MSEDTCKTEVTAAASSAVSETAEARAPLLTTAREAAVAAAVGQSVSTVSAEASSSAATASKKSCGVVRRRVVVGSASEVPAGTRVVRRVVKGKASSSTPGQGMESRQKLESDEGAPKPKPLRVAKDSASTSKAAKTMVAAKSGSESGEESSGAERPEVSEDRRRRDLELVAKAKQSSAVGKKGASAPPAGSAVPAVSAKASGETSAADVMLQMADDADGAAQSKKGSKASATNSSEPDEEEGEEEDGEDEEEEEEEDEEEEPDKIAHLNEKRTKEQLKGGVPPGMDPEVFNALPEDMRRELMLQHKLDDGDWDIRSFVPEGVDPTVWASLPDDVRDELRQAIEDAALAASAQQEEEEAAGLEEREERRRQGDGKSSGQRLTRQQHPEQATLRAPSGVDVEVWNSLPPEIRQELLSLPAKAIPAIVKAADSAATADLRRGNGQPIKSPNLATKALMSASHSQCSSQGSNTGKVGMLTRLTQSLKKGMFVKTQAKAPLLKSPNVDDEDEVKMNAFAAERPQKKG